MEGMPRGRGAGEDACQNATNIRAICRTWVSCHVLLVVDFFFRQNITKAGGGSLSAINSSLCGMHRRDSFGQSEFTSAYKN
jgi:hypothetical protein